MVIVVLVENIRILLANYKDGWIVRPGSIVSFETLEATIYLSTVQLKYTWNKQNIEPSTSEPASCDISLGS